MQNRPDPEVLALVLPEVRGIAFLAEGGYKAVYRATIAGSLEALKVVFIPPALEAPDAHVEISQRIKREIEALASCRCPFLVTLGALAPRVCEISGHTYLVYSEELLAGESLRDAVRSGRHPAFEPCRGLMACLLKVVQELKTRNLIHRDIKPDNVIALDDPARPFVVLDLGIALKLQSTPITRDPEMRHGTLPYMAPETFTPRFHDVLDYRSDLYSAAVTVYEYAAGVHPIARRGEDDYSTMWRIARRAPPPLAQHRPEFPPAFCAMVDQLMRKNPALRPSQLETLQ